MRVAPTDRPVEQITAEAVVVGVYSDSEPSGAAGQIDHAAGGVLSRLIERKEIDAKAYELAPLWSLPGVASPLVLVVGLGARAKLDRAVAFRSAAAAARHLAGKQRGQVAFYLDDGASPQRSQAGVAGALAGVQGQDLYRAEKKRFAPDEILWAGAAEADVQRGCILGESVNLTRRLVNEPPQEIYPESFANQVTEMAGACGLEVEVWDESRLKEERAGALLAVGRGSARPPRLVILRHQGGPTGGIPLALVGKGVTFDSGGLSLKPSDSMSTMKCDMAGAATVAGAMQAIARLKLPLNVVGMMGLVENMPGGGAYKLGDVLTARNGRTIEVLNTDAEGRLVLADVLSLAVDMGAERIIDLATLTGACVVALGTEVAGLMTNDQGWCDTVAAAAAACGEPAWQLPMFEEYDEMIKSEVADIRNTGGVRWAGAITAAKFLQQFVGDVPWTHIDIAGPAFREKPKPWLDAGASGAMVLTLVEVAGAVAKS